MNFKLNAVLILSILSIMNVKGQATADDQLVERIVNAPLITKPSGDLPLINLSINVLNDFWHQLLTEGGPLRYQDQKTMGNSYIELNKLSDTRMELIVYYSDPLGPVNGQQYQIAYKATYKWMEKFETLVALSCQQSVVEVVEPPKFEFECVYGIDFASQVIKVALAANVRNIEEDGYDKLVDCLKQKTIRFEEEKFHKCFIATMDNRDLAKAALSDKITQLIAEGYTCDANNNCTKPVGKTSSEVTVQVEATQQKGDVLAK